MNILVLGGSYLQSCFVEKALESNHNIHVLDRDPNCYLSQNKEITFTAIDISSVDEVDNYFSKEDFDFVISPVTEVGNIISAKISEKYDLRYNSLDTVIATTHKREMRERLKMSKLNEPKVYVYQGNYELDEGLVFPFIVKPSKSSASRGVSLVRNLDEFKAAILEAEKFISDNGTILLEEFIEGEQFSIETVSFNGQHKVVAIVKEVLSGAPYFMERIDIIDKDLNNQLILIVTTFVDELLNALDVKFGPCHIEVKIKGTSVRLIEIASRSGLLRDRLIETAMGINYNKLIIDSYSGKSIEDVEVYLPNENGFLGIIAYPEDMDTFKKLRENGEIREWHLNGNEFASNPKMLTDAVGYFFVNHKDVSYFDKIKINL